MAAVRGITGVLNGLGVSGANLTSGSWSLPSGWVPGDLAVFVWYSRESGRTFTPPGTITQKVQTSSAGFGHLYIGYRFLVAGDTTFSWSATSSTNNTDGYYTVIFQNAASSGDPFERSSGANATTFSNTQSPNPPAITAATVLDKDTVITVFGKNNDVASSVTAPTGYGGPSLGVGNLVQGFEDTSGTDGSSGLAQKPNIAAGTTEDPAAWTLGGASTDDGMQWTGAIRSSVRDTLTADAVFKRNQTGSATADAVIEKAITGSFTANADVLKVQSSSLTANAVIKKTYSNEGIDTIARVNSTFTTGSGTSHGISRPAGVQSGDIVISMFSKAPSADLVSVPSGWSLLPNSDSAGLDDDEGINSTWFAYWVVDGTNPATYTWTTSGSVASKMSVVAYRHVHSSPFDHNAAIGFGVANTINLTWPDSTQRPFTTTYDKALVVGAAATSQNVTLSLSAGYTVNAEGNTNAHHYWDGQVTPPATLTLTTTASGAGAAIEGYLVALRPAPLGLLFDAVLAEAAGPRFGSLIANAVIKRAIPGSSLADAVFLRNQTGSFTASATTAGFIAFAVIKRTQTGSAIADAVFRKTTSSSVTANAVIKKTITWSYYLPLTVVQVASATGPGSNPGPIATFAVAPTAGNVILCLYGGANSTDPAQTSGNTLTRIGSVINAHASFGSWVNTYYRKVQSGDGSSYGFNNIGNSGIRTVEVSGLDTTASPANVANAGGIASSSVSIAVGGGSGDIAFASLVTRLETPSNSDISPNAATTPVQNSGDFVHPNNSIGGIILLYGAGGATLGGTQSGTTRDGYNYGYTDFSWARATGQLTASAVFKKNQTGSLTANAVIKRAQTGSFFSDAVIKRAQTGSLTADAVTRATRAGSATADAVILKTRSSTFTADAILRTTQSGSFAADAVLAQGTVSGSFTADAFIPGRLAADAVFRRVASGSLAADATVLRAQSGSLTANAVIRATIAGALTGAAVILRTSAGSLTANAFIPGRLFADAVFRRTIASLFAADAFIPGRLTANAVIRATQSGSFTGSAYVQGVNVAAFSADAVIFRAQASSFAAGAVILRTVASSSTASQTFYGNTSDAGVISANQSTYAAARAGTGASVTGTGSSITFGQTFVTPNYRVLEALVSFDTSSLGSVQIVDASLALLASGGTPTKSFVAEVRVYDWGTSVEAADFVPGASLSGLTLAAHYSIVAANWSLAGLVTFVNDALSSNINTTGITRFIVVSKDTVDNVAPTTTQEQASFRSTDHGATDQQLTVDYLVDDGPKADAVFLRTQSGSLTAGAVIAGTQSGSLTADAVTRRSGSGSISAASTILRTETGAATADSVIARTISASFGADAVFLRSIAGSSTADAALRISVTGALTADATTLRTQTGSATANAAVTRNQSGSFTGAAVVARATSGTLTADAVVRKVQAGTLTLDGVIFRTIAAALAADAFVAGQLRADAIFLRTKTGQLTADAFIPGHFSAAAVVRATASSSFTASAFVQGAGVGAFSASAVLFATIAGSATTDATILRASSGSETADAVLRRTTTGGITADAVTRATQSGSLTLDAVLVVGTQSGSFVADAVARHTASATVAANAVTRVTAAGALGADAIKRKIEQATIPADAVVLATRTAGASASAVFLSPRTGSVTASAVVRATTSGTFTVDAVLLPASRIFTADAIINSATSGAITLNAMIRRVRPRHFLSTLEGPASFSGVLERSSISGELELGSFHGILELPTAVAGDLQTDSFGGILGWPVTVRTGSLTAGAAIV